jgi:internalin A
LRASSLQSLNCFDTKVSRLEPLAGLASLQSLECSLTPVSRLEPLAGLTSLQSLGCSHTPVSSLPDAVIWRESLTDLILFYTAIRHIPAEVLSHDDSDNCLHRLRAHLRDVQAGDALLPDVKVLVLGNGRIGKTQICNRLRALPFVENADSTHGITVTATPFGGDAVMRLWDFGGQDIYHGTHGLFMRSRAVFVLVWTPDAENSGTHEHGGMTFRNRPLAWWLAYIRHAAGADCPVLVVQNQCDRPEDELLRPPAADAALNAFSFKKLLHYSALNDRGRPALDDALHEAIRWQREQQGQAKVGKGRLAVKDRLDALRNEDAALADVSQRRHRTISQEHFRELCAECGGVSSPELLLDYLYASGVVYYREGLFGDPIILDQGWALEAVYAVFNRRQCWPHLRQLKGRFTRSLLAALVWQRHSEGEQELLLGMMTDCGICFIHRQGDKERGIETEYVAPDLLPDYAEVALEVEAQWDDAAPYDEARVELPFLHPGVMRGLLSRIGGEAGMAGVYWKDGACLYERTTHSHARIEQQVSEKAGEWSGSIVIRTQGGRSMDLARMLDEWACKASESAGCIPKDARLSPKPARPEGKPEKPDFAIPPRKAVTYAVSYAWNDASKTIVDRLCAEATKKHGVDILRDTTGLGLGESIAKFMRSLAASDRVFVILSEKYLSSSYCMYELWQVWLNCRADDEEFRQRIRVYRLPDAAMMKVLERGRWGKYWKDQLKDITDLGLDNLGKEDFGEYKLMLDFANHVGDILRVIADTLLPEDFDELEKHGLGGEDA